jgi:integrase
MARAMNRLTVKSAASLSEPGLHADGGGLYLRIKKTGSKSWTFVFQWNEKRREKGLGPFDVISLADAREKRDEARRTLLNGLNPLDVQKQLESAPTFGEVASDLIRDLELGWKNPKHRQQWRNTLETYCVLIWGRPVDKVGTNDIVDVLKPIWREKPETAARVRGRIERVLDAAKVRGFRAGDNPARWRGHLSLILPANTRGAALQHHAAMPYGQVPDFTAGLGKRMSTAARALEFLIHTAARTGEVIGATWAEVDLEAKTWTVPADRMKMKRQHIVPLTEPAFVVLRAMAIAGTKPEAFIFPGRTGEPQSNMSMAMLMRRLEANDYTVHGFRSSFRDWAGDKTNFPREVAEAALAHSVGDAVERAYRRGSALEKRRELMEAWSAFVAHGATKKAA